MLWRVHDQEKVALFLGRFHNVKGPHHLIDAVPFLPPEWRVIFAGHGPEESKLIERAEIECPGRVGFLPHQLHAGDLLAAADVLVAPSQCEGHSLTVNEAWLAGVPVAMTNHNFAKDMQDRHGSMAELWEPESGPAGLADAILQADAVQDEIRWAIRDIAWTHYTSGAMAGRWEKYLKEVIR
jgi:glycosyltransferase involved in cell wall biosynthesis